jgi:FG-GAP repeat
VLPKLERTQLDELLCGIDVSVRRVELWRQFPTSPALVSPLRRPGDFDGDGFPDVVTASPSGITLLRGKTSKPRKSAGGTVTLCPSAVSEAPSQSACKLELLREGAPDTALGLSNTNQANFLEAGS